MPEFLFLLKTLRECSQRNINIINEKSLNIPSLGDFYFVLQLRLYYNYFSKLAFILFLLEITDINL